MMALSDEQEILLNCADIVMDAYQMETAIGATKFAKRMARKPLGGLSTWSRYFAMTRSKGWKQRRKHHCCCCRRRYDADFVAALKTVYEEYLPVARRGAPADRRYVDRGEYLYVLIENRN
jgi:hypothetical protein